MAKLQFLTPQDLGIENSPTFAGLIINGGIETIDYIQFNTGSIEPAHSTGLLRWNDVDGTYDMHTDISGTILQIGQEMFVKVINKTASPINDGEAVIINGAQGNRPKVILAKADEESTSEGTLGLATANIDINAQGYVTTHGLVRGLNTTGTPVGEVWNEGDTLFLSPTIAGGITNIPPPSPNHTIVIGTCITSHTNQGIIFVRVINGHELYELHDVHIDSIANNDTLQWNDSNSRWENRGYLNVSNIATPSNITDGFVMYSSDHIAGNACPTFMTENGTEIQLNQSLLTTDTVHFNDLYANTGLFVWNALINNLLTLNTGSSKGLVFGDGNTGIYEDGDDVLNFHSVGSVSLKLDPDGISIYTGGFPSVAVVDGFRLYSSDHIAGNAIPTFMTEDGSIIALINVNTNNLAISNGTTSLRKLTSGTLNTTYGPGNTGDEITTGSSNTLIGATCGRTISTGQRNTVIGYGACGLNTTNAGALFGNTCVGFFAGTSLIDNSSIAVGNALFGNNAGRLLTTGSRNIIISNSDSFSVGVEVSAPTANDEMNIGNLLYGQIDKQNIGIGVDPSEFPATGTHLLMLKEGVNPTNNPSASVGTLYINTGTNIGTEALVFRNSLGIMGYLGTRGLGFYENDIIPTNFAGYGQLYTKSDNKLYFINGDGTTYVVQGNPKYKTYHVTTQGLGSNPDVYAAGFYDFSAADANLTQASTTETYGIANRAYSAHAFVVCGGVGSVDTGVVGLRVTGTSINDSGTLIPTDSEIIIPDITTVSLNEYVEGKKWVGIITFELFIVSGSPTTYSLDFNYGYVKYEDFGNNDFTVTDIEVVGLGGATDNNVDIKVLHHDGTGFTYHATSFDPNVNEIASMATDLGAFNTLGSAVPFAWKRDNLSEAINGGNGEGIIIQIITSSNNAIEYADLHLGMDY